MILLPSAKCLKRLGWAYNYSNTISSKKDLIPFQNWAIRNVSIGRREYLLIFEATTLYTIILPGIEKKGMEGKIQIAIREELKELHVSNEIINSACESVEFGKNEIKALTSSINKIENYFCLHFEEPEQVTDLKVLQIACNTYLGRYDDKEYSKPFLRMENLLERKLPEYHEKEFNSFEKFRTATTLEGSYAELKVLFKDFSGSPNSLRIFFRLFQCIWDFNTKSVTVFPDIIRLLNPTFEKAQNILDVLSTVYNNLVITLGQMDSFGIKKDWKGVGVFITNLSEAILNLEKDIKITAAVLKEAAKIILESGDYYHSFNFSKGAPKYFSDSEIEGLPEGVSSFYVLSLILRNNQLDKNTEEGGMVREDLLYQIFICAHYLNFRRMIREEIGE